MANGEVDFLGDADPPPQAPQSRQRLQPSPLLRAAAVVTLAAAVLAALAPFRALGNISVAAGARNADYLGRAAQTVKIVDGWGRRSQAVSGPLATSGVRWGVALTVCAVLLTGLAALCVLVAAQVRSRTSRGHSRRLLNAAAIGVPAALTGLVAGLGLYVYSGLEQPIGWVAYSPLQSGENAPAPFRIAVEPGGCWWLSVAALSCAAAGAGLVVLAHLTGGGSRG